MMKRLSIDRIFAIVATTAVVCGLAAGFWVVGTPGRQRLVNADRRRLQDIRRIAQNLYWKAQEQNGYTLPESLPENDLARDPLTDRPYEYRRLTESAYQLCAEFGTDSSTYPLQNRSSDAGANRWEHPQGNHCFDFDVTEQPPNFSVR